MDTQTLLNLLGENPEALADIIHAYVEKYKPAAYKTVGELYSILRDLILNEQLPKDSAKSKKMTYDALIAEGFDADQALALMINDNVRLMNNLKNSANKLAKKGSN